MWCTCVCVCGGGSCDLGIGLVPRASTLAFSYKSAQRPSASLLQSQPGRARAGPQRAAALPLGHVTEQGMVSRAPSFQPCHGALSIPCCLNTKYPFGVGWGSGGGRWLNPGDGSELGEVWDNVWKWSSGDSLTFPECSLLFQSVPLVPQLRMHSDLWGQDSSSSGKGSGFCHLSSQAEAEGRASRRNVKS